MEQEVARAIGGGFIRRVTRSCCIIGSRITPAPQQQQRHARGCAVVMSSLRRTLRKETDRKSCNDEIKRPIPPLLSDV